LGDFRERIGTLGYDPHYGSEGNALLAFHQFFTPDCLIDALLTTPKQNKTLLSKKRVEH
jgi:hypothetical protein